MRRFIGRIAGVASLASLMMVGTADAASIIAYGAVPGGTKTATNPTSSTTTVTTNSASNPGSVLTTVSLLGNQATLPGTQAKETFLAPNGVTAGIVSNGAATVSPTGIISQPFNGVITFIDPTLNTNYLTITFTNATLTGQQGGLTVNLKGDSSIAGETVTFASADSRVTPFINDPVRNFDFSLTGLNTGLQVTNGTIAPFISTNEGGAASTIAVPEPASVVMASTAVLAGLGCFGYRRFGSRSL
jgi:hypothetical protein